MRSKDVGKNRSFENEFSSLLEASLKNASEANTGDHVIAKILPRESKEFVFVSTGMGDGIIAREELEDEDGKLTVIQGEQINAFFKEAHHGDRIFTTRPTGKDGLLILRKANELEIPLQGRITREIKGGYEVKIGDFAAFCPASQIEESLASTGNILTFMVAEATERKLVVSRKAVEKREREAKKEIFKTNLAPGDVLTGKVKSLHDFGAFVDLGGLDGLVPISELSYSRISNPAEVVKVGEEIRVKIMEIDWKDDRLTLSYRALLANPWEGSLPFDSGEIVQGTVESIKLRRLCQTTG